MKVLLVHGLDTPADGGRKAAVLRKAYGVENIKCPDMRLRDYKHIFRSPSRWTFLTYFGTASSLVYAVVVLIRAIRALLNRRFSSVARSSLLSLIIADSARRIYKAGRKRLVAAMMLNGIRIQTETLKNFKPDVIVASSFGGAITVDMLRSGIIDIPVVLIAPAQTKIANILQTSHPVLTDASAGGVVVVHSPCDSTIPYSDSVALVQSVNSNKVTSCHPNKPNLASLTSTPTLDSGADRVNSGRDLDSGSSTLSAGPGDAIVVPRSCRLVTHKDPTGHAMASFTPELSKRWIDMGVELAQAGSKSNRP